MSRLIRQIHRWVSILFVLAFTAGGIEYFGMHMKAPDAWIGYAVVLALGLMIPTGLYMFVLPYVSRRR